MSKLSSSPDLRETNGDRCKKSLSVYQYIENKDNVWGHLGKIGFKVKLTLKTCNNAEDQFYVYDEETLGGKTLNFARLVKV